MNGDIGGGEVKIDGSAAILTNTLGDLQFEEDEEEGYYSKDLPDHACRWGIS